MTNRTHVYPPAEHDTDGLDCFCQPEYFRVCDEDHPDTEPCWKCGPRGMIPLTRAEAEAIDEPIVIVHRYNP